MKKNSYSIRVGDITLENFEFIAGPMAAISIPQPPRKPETFIAACFKGGATPIIAPRDADLDIYLQDVITIKKRMPDSFIGANIFAPWGIAANFIKAMSQQEEILPDFIDINAIELNFNEIMPLLKEIRKPIYLGINQPISIYTFKKYLQKKEYAYLIDKIALGTLKLYLPQSYGGGHLPILKKEQTNQDWTASLLDEVLAINEEYKLTTRFIVEKGMLTVDDFVQVIQKYSQYPGFSGVRFASLLELTRESGLNDSAKAFLADIVQHQKRDMLIPIRSVIGASKPSRGRVVRGGVITFVAATALAQKIHNVQCAGEDFPKFSRPYKVDALLHQVGTVKKREQRTDICGKCIRNCPQEYCELGAAWESVIESGDIDAALMHISPRILEIDPAYIGAPTDVVVRDTIQNVLQRFK